MRWVPYNIFTLGNKNHKSVNTTISQNTLSHLKCNQLAFIPSVLGFYQSEQVTVRLDKSVLTSWGFAKLSEAFNLMGLDFIFIPTLGLS